MQLELLASLRHLIFKKKHKKVQTVLTLFDKLHNEQPISRWDVRLSIKNEEVQKEHRIKSTGIDSKTVFELKRSNLTGLMHLHFPSDLLMVMAWTDVVV